MKYSLRMVMCGVAILCALLAAAAHYRAHMARISAAEQRLYEIGGVFQTPSRRAPSEWLRCLLGERFFCPLTDLSLYPETAATDDDIKHAAQIPTLQWLNLCNTLVTDKGLKVLEGLCDVTFIDVRGTYVTEDGVAEFRRRFPHCEVLSGPSPNPMPWAPLMRSFLERIGDAGGRTVNGDDVFEVFVRNRWFRTEVAREAGRALDQKRRPLRWRREVEGAALLWFRAEFRKQPDLGMRSLQINATFPEFIAAELRCACNDVIDQLDYPSSCAKSSPDRTAERIERW